VQDLDWLVTNFAEPVRHVAHAVVVSAGGFALAFSSTLPRGHADQLAAVTSGLAGLADGAACTFGAGEVIQTNHREAGARSDAASVERGPVEGASPEVARPAPSRRRLLTGASLAGAGVVAGGLGGYFARQPGTAAAASNGGTLGNSSATVSFYGKYQAGIATLVQDRLAFGSLNVVDGTSPADLRDVLAAWTTAAADMTAGQLVGEVTEPDARPVDTGEAVGSPVSNLTITVGYGPSLFDGRFGLASRKPAALADLPPLPNENLDPDYTGGDLCIQACSDDPLVAFHAVRNLARIGMGVVEHNWLELGFGKTSSTSTSQQTPRNLLGFKDGTALPCDKGICSERARPFAPVRAVITARLPRPSAVTGPRASWGPLCWLARIPVLLEFLDEANPGSFWVLGAASSRGAGRILPVGRNL